MKTQSLNNGFAGAQKTNERILYKKIGNLKNLFSNYISLSINDMVLIAGCGKGDEALVFNKIFLSHTIGIDINLPSENIIKTDNVELLQADLNATPFSDNTFSLIYNYHVLEHVNTPENVLKEFNRVLKNDGAIFIGFPNRLRLTPAYIKSNLNKKLFDIIKNNVKDYWKKLIGKFRNELGAHAGFSEKEFINMAKPYFNEIIPIRQEWIKYQYPKFYKISIFAAKIKIENYLYPSNFYILKK